MPTVQDIMQEYVQRYKTLADAADTTLKNEDLRRIIRSPVSGFEELMKHQRIHDVSAIAEGVAKTLEIIYGVQANLQGRLPREENLLIWRAIELLDALENQKQIPTYQEEK